MDFLLVDMVGIEPTCRTIILQLSTCVADLELR